MKLKEITEKLREEDKLPVKRVVEHLNSHGLDVELVGSAAEGKKGYSDIDLYVKGKLNKKRKAMGSINSYLHMFYSVNHSLGKVDKGACEIAMQRPIEEVWGYGRCVYGRYAVLFHKTKIDLFFDNQGNHENKYWKP